MLHTPLSDPVILLVVIAVAQIFTVRLQVIQRMVLLSQFCLSVCASACLSVRCMYWDKTKSIPNSDTSSLSTPTGVAGNCLLTPDVFVESEPPPSKNVNLLHAVATFVPLDLGCSRMMSCKTWRGQLHSELFGHRHITLQLHGLFVLAKPLCAFA